MIYMIYCIRGSQNKNDIEISGEILQIVFVKQSHLIQGTIQSVIITILDNI